jgi:hypothetical protein
MPQAHRNETTERIKRWLATDPVNTDRKMIQTAIAKEWKERWQREVEIKGERWPGTGR